MMSEQPTYHSLKFKFQQLGPLREEAWAFLFAAVESREVAPGKSIVRHTGDLGYVVTGVLKEYNVHQRDSPAVVNFLSDGDVFINWPYTATQYLKAVVPTTVWLLPEAALTHILHQFPETQRIYDGLSFEYAERLAFRPFLLEHRETALRIALFKRAFRPVLPYLRYRDIANYTMISYDHLARHFSRIS